MNIMHRADVLFVATSVVCRYYHRPIDFKKLLLCGFIGGGDGLDVDAVNRKANFYSMDRWFKKSAVEKRTFEEIFSNKNSLLSFGASFSRGFRPMLKEDVHQVRLLLNGYLNRRFKIGPLFENDQEIAHWFLPRRNVVYSFVHEEVESSSQARPVSSPSAPPSSITSFISFYELSSRVLCGKSDNIRAAYLFYYALPPSSESGDDGHFKMLRAALMVAYLLGFDVLNCLNIMDNDQAVLDRLKFSLGDGELNYYFYNWKCSLMSPSEISFLLQ